ncbi:MAG: hypothetical protein M3P39_08005 [Actinomycetota bacterium]|nr:hypothetical protein [Actinomycetota bacterium]
MDDEQRKRFEQALERKQQEAQEKGETQQPFSTQADDPSGVHTTIEQSLIAPGTPQDTFSARDKNQGKGKKTADKWNQ